MDLQTIYQEMRTKRGWQDGNNEPNGSYEVRDDLVRLINANLPPDCPVEAYGFNRNGLHNGALLLYRKKGVSNILSSGGHFGEEAEPECVQEILSEAQEEEVLCVEVTIDSCRDSDHNEDWLLPSRKTV